MNRLFHLRWPVMVNAKSLIILAQIVLLVIYQICEYLYYLIFIYNIELCINISYL